MLTRFQIYHLNPRRRAYPWYYGSPTDVSRIVATSFARRWISSLPPPPASEIVEEEIAR